MGAGSPRDAASKPSTTTAQRRASGGGQAQAGGPSKDASQPGTSPRAYARKIGRRLDEAFAELRSRLEGEELPEPGVPGRAKPGVDEAELERQIDAEMEQLKRQLGLGRSSPGSASSGASTGASAQASTNDEAAVDEELEALKRKRDE